MNNQLYIKKINSLIAKVDDYLSLTVTDEQKMRELENEVNEFRVEVWKSDMEIEIRDQMREFHFDRFFLKPKKKPWFKSFLSWRHFWLESFFAKPEGQTEMTHSLRSLRNQLEELLNDFKFFK